jgi:hypothetical protein
MAGIHIDRQEIAICDYVREQTWTTKPVGGLIGLSHQTQRFFAAYLHRSDRAQGFHFQIPILKSLRRISHMYVFCSPYTSSHTAEFTSFADTVDIYCL